MAGGGRRLEQHCYPIANDLKDAPNQWWYMGDIPHGWAAAEFLLLMRDILFFEADEDNDPHIYIAPGVLPHWFNDNEEIGVRNAKTVFGESFSYRLTLHEAEKRIEIVITEAPKNIRFIYPCLFGNILSAQVDGINANVLDNQAHLPAGANNIAIHYE